MENEGRACAVLCGEPEVIEQVMKALLDMADVADENGMQEEADLLASMIPDLKIMKAAQYEGFQNYWIANQRAFELALKHRLEAQKDEDKSYQSAWMDTLQDYIDSLLGPQTEFIGKNMKTAQYEGFQNYWLMNSRAFELAFLEKLGQQPEKDKSFFKAWMEVLDDYQDCKDRQNFLEEALQKKASKDKKDIARTVLAEAKRRGATVGELYCEWADCHRQALQTFLKNTTAKMERGEHPAVAVYESLDYFMSGEHSKDTIVKLQVTAKKVEAGLKKQSGWRDELKQLFFGWRAYLSDLWDKVTFRSGPGMKLVNRLNAMGNWFLGEHEKLRQKVVIPGGSLDPAMVHNRIGPYLEYLRALVSLINAPGSAARLQAIPELFTGGSPNPEFFDPELKGMGPQEFDAYFNKLADVIEQAKPAAKEYDLAMKEGIVGTNDVETEKPEDSSEKAMANALRVSATMLAETLKRYSNTIDFKNMVQEVQDPPIPWKQKLEEASANAMITQGRAPAGSVDDATTDLVSQFMGIITPYINKIVNEINASDIPNTQKAKLTKELDVISRALSMETQKRVKQLINEKFNLMEMPK